MYQKVPLTLTGPQLRKLELGHTIQLKPDALQNPKHHMYVHPTTAKKIHNAIKTGKGCRMCATRPEIEMSGEGLSDIWHFLKNAAYPVLKDKAIEAYHFAKDKVLPEVKKFVASDYYQQNIKPTVRAVVDKAVDMVPPNYGAHMAAEVGKEYLSEKTGAFGIKKSRTKKVTDNIKAPKPKSKPKPKPKAGIKGGSFKIH